MPARPSTRPLDPTLTLAIVAAFVIGKPAGSSVQLPCGAHAAGRPPVAAQLGLIASGSLLTGIGFAMALFIAELAFAPALQDTVKLGILIASGVSAAMGLLALLAVTMRRRVPKALAIGPEPRPRRT